MAASSTTHNAFDKSGALCGLFSLALYFLVFPCSGWLPPPSPSQTADDIVEHYKTHQSGIQAGAALMTLIVITWTFFTASIASQLSRIPGLPRGVLYAQVVSGAIFTVYLSFPAYLLLLAAYRLDRPASTTVLIHDFAWMLMIFAFPALFVQDICFSYAILQDRRERPLFPRWLAYTSTGLSMFYWLAFGVPIVKSGAMAWNGALGFWVPAVAGFASVGLISVYVYKAVGRNDLLADGEGQKERMVECVEGQGK